MISVQHATFAENILRAMSATIAIIPMFMSKYSHLFTQIP